MRAFGDTGLSTEANEYAAEFIRGKIKEKVKDPETARKLLPDTAVGCKRLCADSGYFETFNEPHVQLVDLRETPLKGLYADGVETDGARYEVDAVVFATGFDAMTGALARIDIRGRNGQALTEAWAEGPKSYLGLQVVGFPNLFTVTGPGSPSVLTNMLPSIEQHVRFIGDAIGDLKAEGYATMEAEPEAQEAWVGHVNEVGDATIYPTCNSWYVGANIPGKPRVFMPYLGFPAYCEKCDAVRAAGYEGFHRAA
jgi:cyclohexanone monooxygenase